MCVHLRRWVVGVVCDSIRNTTLDIISRLPASEAVEPFAAVLMTSVMKCLEDDNEENALVCLRVLFELFKNVKTTSMEVGRWWACMFGRRVCDSALCGFRVCTSMSHRVWDAPLGVTSFAPWPRVTTNVCLICLPRGSNARQRL